MRRELYDEEVAISAEMTNAIGYWRLTLPGKVG